MKKALLIGINKYDTQKNLRGCVNDTKEMSDLLNNRFNFNNVYTITDKDATKEIIFKEIRELLEPEEDETDGVRVIFVASHGGRILDVPINGDEIDKIDEALCLSSYNWYNKETYISDDDLAVILDYGYKNADYLRTYVIFDCCHSGTGTRDLNETWEQKEFEAKATYGIDDLKELDLDISDSLLPFLSISREASERPEVNNLRISTTNYSPIGYSTEEKLMNHLLLSGCSASQTCKDVPIDKDYHGIFTYSLTRLIDSNPNATWEEIHTKVNEVIADGFHQNPQLEGPEYLKQRPIFS